jgi:ABC-type uncharacterized transport system permease subunit
MARLSAGAGTTRSHFQFHPARLALPGTTPKRLRTVALMNGTRRSRITGRIVDLATPLLALGMALLVGAVMLALLNTNPLEAYGAAWAGVMTKNGMADTLVKAIPLALVGLGIVIAFRANVINIGAEGQIIVGALATTFVAVEIGERMPGWSLIILATAAGMLAGGLWAALPGCVSGGRSSSNSENHWRGCPP